MTRSCMTTELTGSGHILRFIDSASISRVLRRVSYSSAASMLIYAKGDFHTCSPR